MKFITAITLGLLTTITLNAKTTMCFKENHSSISTIESTALDGGLCSSTKSVKDMKKSGWTVDDIKIEKSLFGNNYIYIFKKDEALVSSLNEEQIEQRIMQRLENKKQEELTTKKRNIKTKMSEDGKSIYLNKCQQCHGTKAEKEAYGVARPLNSLSLDDMTLAIRDYYLGEYNRGKAFIMKPYASLLTENDVKNIYSYIQSLKMEDEKSIEESK